MSATTLLQGVSQALFVVVFLVTLLTAVRHPRRANVDTALLFGAVALLVAQGWVTATWHLRPNSDLSAIGGSLLMALPYLLLRLVYDFAGVPRPLLGFAAAGLAVAAGTLVLWLVVLGATLPEWLALLDVAYFVILTVYVAAAFVRASLRSSGVTRRRMQAVATGSLFLGFVLFGAGLAVVLPRLAAGWSVLSLLCALVAGLAFFVGFAPPMWLRRAWQEPEVRAFLAQAASLPRLPDTAAIVRTLEQGAAASLGAPRASIGLWDGEAQVLRFARDRTPNEAPPGRGFGGRAFATQRSLFSADAERDEPAHAAAYRANRVRAVLAVPITAGEKRLGVLVVDAPRAPIFAEDDLRLAQLLADQAAVILESRALIDEAARVRAHDEVTRLKEDFLSAAAHDLKTPLTVVIAQAQLLAHRARRDPTAPADLRGIERLMTEAGRLKRLVLDLLDVSQAAQGRLVSTREVVDLVALARESCTLHSSPHHQCVLDAAKEVAGAYDANRITQLLDNLLENAVKYSPDGGEVRVRVWREGDEAHLSVADTGIGIPAADLPYLFDRFHRAANVDDRRFAGMGLGLYICRSIAEQHGGRIGATSAGPGQGSTFHVVLPITMPAADGERDEARPEPLLAAAEEAL